MAHEHVEVRNSAGLLDPDSLEERIARAEHEAGLLQIGIPGRQSHCWLCRRHYEESGAALERQEQSLQASPGVPK